MKNLFKTLHIINKVTFFTTLILYFTLILGMYFQMVLGAIQLIIALVLVIKFRELNKNSKKYLLTYWFLVTISILLIYLNIFFNSDFGNSVLTLIIIFIIPMCIATYFYFLTANLNNDSFLTANWTNLILINFEVNPKILEKYLPKGTELDFYNEKCYVSLVGFMFENVKVLGLKIPFHINFEEVNLRFYVKRFENNEWKRGVVFIKEIVPKPAISFIANTIYNEHYQTLPMKKFNLIQDKNFNYYEYQWIFKNKTNKIAVKTDKIEQEIAINSEAEFITEHYFGYTKVTENKTFEYEVKHPIWKQYLVKETIVKVDFKSVYGEDFSFLNQQKPVSTIFALGSEISVENKKRIS
jgi:uncharacterized protein YqjF (DUF2071 family)